MKIVVVIIVALFALASCVTIHNYPNQQAPQYIMPEIPEGTEHVKVKLA